MRKTKEELVVELTEMRRELQGELDFVNSMLAVAERQSTTRQSTPKPKRRYSRREAKVPPELRLAAVERAVVTLGRPVSKRAIAAHVAPEGISEVDVTRALTQLTREGRLVRAGQESGVKGNRPLYVAGEKRESPESRVLLGQESG